MVEFISFDRKAFVKLRSSRSRLINITSGVPQGSILGPLIFVLFINDLCSQLKSEKLLYADDLKIFKVITSVVDCCALQNDIDSLQQWCYDNGMAINITKTKMISFTRRRSAVNYEYKIDNIMLERVCSIRDLGVIVDHKLRFNEHIAVTTTKAFAVLGFIRRNTVMFDDINALKALYCSLVRSILEYAKTIWNPYHAVQITRIERVQKSFLRYVLRQPPGNDPSDLPHYEDRCRLLNLETLSSRRKRVLVFDLLVGNIDCSSLLQYVNLTVPTYQFRSHPFLTIPRHRTTYGFNGPLCSCMREFNNVSTSFDFNITKDT